jgi:benzodiazapine receptor
MKLPITSEWTRPECVAPKPKGAKHGKINIYEIEITLVLGIFGVFGLSWIEQPAILRLFRVFPVFLPTAHKIQERIINMEKILKLVFSIGICEAVGITGAFFTGPAVSSTWYASLVKPFFQPPAWLFAPAWTTLYVLMGIALYLVWSHKSAMALFFVQLFFNGLWSILFFGLKSPFLAFLDIVILWLLILVLVFKFFEIRKAAGWLILPYLIWVSFAAVLNGYLWILN